MSYGTAKKKKQELEVFEKQIEEMKTGTVEEVAEYKGDPEVMAAMPETAIEEPEEETALPLDVQPEPEPDSPF